MKNILIPISFSETSKNALQEASFIAKQYNASLSLLHCYAAQDYNRPYNFGNVSYEIGIKQMLLKFYEENTNNDTGINVRFLAQSGSLLEVVNNISHDYDFLIISRKTGFKLKSNKSYSDKIYNLTLKSKCPVLLLPTKNDIFNFTELNTIWHIQRKENELQILTSELQKLKIDPSIVITKSLKQSTFTSVFWRNIVNYTRTHDDGSIKNISEYFTNEHIDLLIFVNQSKSLFEKILKDEAFQTISQFDIPILIFQGN
jgi:hypothetical protein